MFGADGGGAVEELVGFPVGKKRVFESAKIWSRDCGCCSAMVRFFSSGSINTLISVSGEDLDGGGDELD